MLGSVDGVSAVSEQSPLAVLTFPRCLVEKTPPGGREPGYGRAEGLRSTRLSRWAWGTPDVPNCLLLGHVGGLSPSLCSHQAFFTERYLQEHPEAHEKIEKLKDLIAWQVNISRQLQGRVGKAEPGTRSPWASLALLPAATECTPLCLYRINPPATAAINWTPGRCHEYEHLERSLLQMSRVCLLPSVGVLPTGKSLVSTEQNVGGKVGG